MRVYDRILDKEILLSQIDSPLILGRYLFIEDKNEIQLNESDVKNHDYLVPCKSNEGSYRINSDKIKLLFYENDLLNEDVSSLVKHTLSDISNELQKTDDLSNLKDINIILRNFDERLEINDFEQFLQKKLFHIEEVCREPSYHLKREITKLNVARAKRIPFKAINYLAAHTEDWSRRRIRSVEPRKILTEVVDYDLQIYENQITTSFIDKLLVYFSQRMVNEIDVIDSFIDTIEKIIESRKITDYKDNVYWYKKLDRDYNKLGKAVESIENSRAKIEKIKEFITFIQMRLFGLLKSDLYLANSNRKNIISQKLKRTNLFDNHQHYRFVKVLWDKFHRKELLNCSEISEENQKIISSYIDFSWILIIRSLFQIGFRTEKQIKRHSFIFVNEFMPNVSIKAEKTENDQIELIINNNKLKFIPIPSTKENIKKYPKKERNRYYFTLVGSVEREDIFNISPTNINSEEQITGIIFRYFLESYSDSYLFKLDSLSISNFAILKNWLKERNSLILDNGKNGKIDFWMMRKLNLREVKEFHKVITEQKQHLNARTDIRHRQISQLTKIENEIISTGNDHFEKFETCISCSTVNSSNIKSLHGGGFNYKCNNKDCGVEYGFKDQQIYYKVPNNDVIKRNLSKQYSELSDDILLNAFGFENI